MCSKIARVLCSNLRRCHTACTYEQAFQTSLNNPTDFWAEQAEKLTWFDKWNTVLDDSNAPYVKWFSGARDGDTTALIYDSPITDKIKKYSYKDLQAQVQVAKFAQVLDNQGVTYGDRVLIYMPMIPEVIIAMLACARIGAIHIVVFGGFAAKELSVRIGHSQPKVIVSASAGLEPGRTIEYKPILDEAIQLSSSKPKSCIIFQRENVLHATMTKGKDFDWDQEMDSISSDHVYDCVPVESSHPLYIIHTSGTTGLPKGIVRPTGGYAVVLPWTMSAVYGINPGETWWAASDMGWAVGHSYTCYAPLLAGLTSVLYEGKPVGTPDSGQFFRVCEEHKVVSFFCAPTAMRAIRQVDAEAVNGSKYDIGSLRVIFSAGEHLDFETRLWAEKVFKVPVLDHWWQTESGWPMCAPCIGYQGTDLKPPKDASGTGLVSNDRGIRNMPVWMATKWKLMAIYMANVG